MLLGDQSAIIPRITVASFRGIAEELYQLAFGRKPRVADEAQVGRALADATAEAESGEFSARFLISEWTHVVDAWQIDTEEFYANVPRLGRKSRLGAKQRARLCRSSRRPERS